MDLSDSLAAHTRTHSRRKPPMTPGFIAIIVFKYLKGVLFFMLGIGALRIARLPDVPNAVQIARFFRSDPEGELVRRVAEILRELTPGQTISIGVIALVVGLVFTMEATFLSFRIWWSTYFTIVLTAMGIPLEVYEILRRPASVRRYALLAINAAILIFLWARRNEFRGELAPGQSETARRATEGVP
jgi:uncharacterized membrane protein (DUF2068 family)